MVFVLCSGAIQLYAERDLKLTRLSAIISHCMVRFMKYSKFNTAFLHYIVITFSPIYLSEAAYVISQFNLMTVIRVNSRFNNCSMNLSIT